MAGYDMKCYENFKGQTNNDHAQLSRNDMKHIQSINIIVIEIYERSKYLQYVFLIVI